MEQIEFLKKLQELIYSGTFPVPFATVNNYLLTLNELIKEKENELKKEEE